MTGKDQRQRRQGGKANWEKGGDREGGPEENKW